MVTVKSWGPIQKCNFWWGSNPQLLARVTKNSIEPTAKLLEARASLECLSQRRWVRDKVWAPSKIVTLDGVKSLNCGSESQRILSSPRPNWSKLERACNVMLWWGIGRESCIRTTCNLRLWVVKHPNQRRLESYRGTALAGFEPVTICFRDCFKMPRELGGGFEWKITVLDSELPLLLLKQE